MGAPMHLRLGWCVVGPIINQTKASKFGCNRIMFRSADTVKSGNHYFTAPIGRELLTGNFVPFSSKSLTL